MAKTVFDGVVDAVHLDADGQVETVRVYERIAGAAFTDRILLTRAEFVARLKAKKRFTSAVRQEYLGCTFEPRQPVYLVSSGGKDILSTEKHNPSGKDMLTGIPIF